MTRIKTESEVGVIILAEDLLKMLDPAPQPLARVGQHVFNGKLEVVLLTVSKQGFQGLSHLIEQSIYPLDIRIVVFSRCGMHNADRRPQGSRLVDAFFHLVFDFPPVDKDKGYDAVEAMDDIAASHGATVPQVALAWLLAKGETIVPIPGTRSARHLEDNAQALEVDLSADDVAALDAAVPPGAAEGERYPPGALKHLHK